MDTVKLSSTGQLVIPKAVTDALHLLPETEFVISRTATGLALTPKIQFPATTASEVRGCLAKPGRKMPDDDVSRERILATLREQDEMTLD